MTAPEEFMLAIEHLEREVRKFAAAVDALAARRAKPDEAEAKRLAAEVIERAARMN